MLIKKSILRSLGDQSWGFQVSCEATASEYWELSEQDGPFFAVKCLRLTLGFVPIEASIVTHMSDWRMRKSQLQSLETLHPWSLNWTLLLAIFFYFFFNGTETEMRQPSLTVAFCNTCTVLSIIHDVFSLTVPWTMRSTPVCLFQKEPCGMREHVPEVHTLKKSLFSSGFGENHMS